MRNLGRCSSWEMARGRELPLRLCRGKKGLDSYQKLETEASSPRKYLIRFEGGRRRVFVSGTTFERMRLPPPCDPAFALQSGKGELDADLPMRWLEGENLLDFFFVFSDE